MLEIGYVESSRIARFYPPYAEHSDMLTCDSYLSPATLGLAVRRALANPALSSRARELAASTAIGDGVRITIVHARLKPSRDEHLTSAYRANVALTRVSALDLTITFCVCSPSFSWTKASV